MKKFREYTVDLTMPVADRWSEQAADKWAQRQAKALLAEAQAAIPLCIPSSIVTVPLDTAFDLGAGEYAEELRALCAEARIDYGDAVFGNLSYELSYAGTSPFNVLKAIFGCSSVGFYLPRLGMVHARNLDWPLDGMEKATCQVRFVGASAGEFTAVTVPGLVGVLSGIAPGRFSASLNYADSAEVPNLYGGWSMPLLIRHVFETCKTYKAALRKLQQATPICPAFVQLVGVEEGEAAVIELSPRSKNVVHRMNGGPLAITNHYLDDEDELEAETDADGDLLESSVSRRQALEKAAGRCKAAKLDSVLAILRNPPVFNEWTKQSMVFCPATGMIVSSKNGGA